MQYYETTIILDPLLDDEKVTAAAEKYSDFLAKEGSSVKKTEKSGRKKFAYPIRNKRTGSYVSIEFEGTPGTVSKLERTLQLDENVLRYLTVSYDRKTLQERQMYFQKKAEYDAEREKAPAAATQEAQKPEQQEDGAIPGKAS
jgi:small subunit ribosomal protein S6